MNRSPLFYPLARNMDSEAGGAADLQTDVMRFMAILALCLVAIFALVQTIPIEQDKEGKPAPVKPEPVSKSPPPKTATKLETKAAAIPLPEMPVARATTEVRQVKPVARALPQPAKAQSIIARHTIPGPNPADARPADNEEGFTLRFETDLALTQLVAQNKIGLYAINGKDAFRMTINQDKAEFWSASLPKQYHQMDTATVPDAIVNALRMSGGQNVTHARWGVTLPPAMTETLEQFMNNYRGGALIIGTDGILRRER